MGNVTHFGRVALFVFLPSNDVHRELQRLTAFKRCNSDQNKPTENPQNEENMQKYVPIPVTSCCK